MTFEEFFIKKKIDLTQLKQAEPALFSEFKNHFEQMGEKSFDHTKKFWFNKLRRSYRLKEEPKPQKEILIKTKIASQAEPLASPTIDQKPVEAPVVTNATLSEESAKQTEGLKASIKPKFTPRNITVKPKETPEGGSEKEVTKEEATKPVGFKPRFNAKTIKPKEEEPETDITPEAEEKQPQTEQSTEAKAAYKPKFNLKNIKPKEESGPDLPASAESKQPEAELPAETKPAYKPKFNLKNIKPKEESGMDVPASAPERPKPEELPLEKPAENVNESNPAADIPEKKETKPIYKPRFNMKNIKPPQTGNS